MHVYGITGCHARDCAVVPQSLSMTPIPWPFEWLIGWRYTRAARAARRNRFISFISSVSMLGIALCSFAAQLLLNRGFQIELAAKASAVNYTQVWVCVRGPRYVRACVCVPKCAYMQPGGGGGEDD